MSDRPEIFFVLNSLINGAWNCAALDEKSVVLKDGWYVGPSHSATRMGPYENSRIASWVADQLRPYSDTTNVAGLIEEHVKRSALGAHPSMEEVVLTLLVELVEVHNVVSLSYIKQVLESWDFRRAEEPSEYM